MITINYCHKNIQFSKKFHFRPICPDIGTNALTLTQADIFVL